jgi:hypothetical protein
MACLE